MPDTTVHLGRDTDATMRAVARLGPVLASAPKLPAPYAAVPPRSLRIDKFRNTRYRGQLIGDCVGEALAAMGETTIRTPEKFTQDTPPNPPVDLSALWCYWIARAYSFAHGVRLGSEGAIVSHGHAAAREKGFRPYGLWPSTEATYANYRDSQPPRGIQEADPIPVQGESFVLTDGMDEILAHLAAGYSVDVGTAWRGAQQTDASGYLPWGSGSIGGHSYELLWYDKELDLIGAGNSWDNARFGLQPGGLFTMTLSVYAREFTPQRMASGESEAIVIRELGAEPPVSPVDWGKAWGA